MSGSVGEAVGESCNSPSSDIVPELDRHRKAIMVGLPRTGKTSFLGLLFVSIVYGADEDLRLEKYDQEHSYLNEIAEKLLGFESADHTHVDQQDGLNLAVRLPNGGAVELRIPDLSGETWQAAHLERVLSLDMSERIAEADGFILFTHVDDFVPSTTIAQGKAAALDLGVSEEDWIQGADPVLIPAESATQVALVDLIQILQERRREPFRLSLVLSAYDLATSVIETSPKNWVQMNMPLLHQFLNARAVDIESRIFGVSAQGGSYHVSDATIKLEEDLLRRAYVLDEDGSQCAVRLPLFWALGDD